MYVKSFPHYEGEIILPESIFVSIDTIFRLHEPPQMPLKSLEQSWLDTKDYVLRARALLDRPPAGHFLMRIGRGCSQ